MWCWLFLVFLLFIVWLYLSLLFIFALSHVRSLNLIEYYYFVCCITILIIDLMKYISRTGVLLAAAPVSAAVRQTAVALAGR